MLHARGLLIAANGVSEDFRVRKMARSMVRCCSDVVIVGLFVSDNPEARPRRESLDGLEVIKFPWVNPDFGLMSRQVSEGRVFRRCEVALDEWAKRVEDFAVDYRPLLLQTHCDATVSLGVGIKEKLAINSERVIWLHDVRELATGQDSLLRDPKLPEAHREATAAELSHLQKADMVLTVSEPLKKKLSDALPNLNGVTVIYDSPPVTKSSYFEGPSLRKRLGINKDLLGVYTGPVEPSSGLQKIIPILKQLPELHFAIVTSSSGDDVDSIRSQALQMDVHKRLHWHPLVGPEDIVQFIAGADFGVIPNERDANTELVLPANLFEYCLAGAEVLSSDLLTISEFLSTWQVGTTTNFQDPGASARDLLALLKRPEPLRVESARLRFVKEFSWETQEAKLVELYRQLLGKPFSNVLSTVADLQLPEDTIRVFQGPSRSAQQPQTLARALNSRPNLSARSFSMPIWNHDFPADVTYPLPTKRGSHDYEWKILPSLSSSFDVFHFHFRGLFHDPRNLAFPVLLDLVLLKAAGKGVVFHFRGSEARIRSEFMRRNPFQYGGNRGDKTSRAIEKSFPEEKQKAYINLVCAIADRVYVTDPEIATYVPGAEVVQRAIDLGKWQMVGLRNRSAPLIVHAPTRRHIKGTDFVLAAVSELRREGLEFDFQLVEGLNNNEARGVYEKADIIIDQLRIGWYGVLAVEGMALGKVVVSHVSDDLLGSFGDEPLPFANANPNTITNVLRELILFPEKREFFSRAGRKYVESVHDADKIAEILHAEYLSILKKPKPVEVEQLVHHFRQFQVAQTMTASEASTGNGSLVSKVKRAYRRGGFREIIAAVNRTRTLRKRKEFR